MKTIFYTLLVLSFITFSSSAQNTFPATGNVGIGTTSPASALDVNGAISIKGANVNELKSIPVPSDGTYVVASGSRIKGTYTLNFEAANRIQTVILLVSATQYDSNSTISILGNTAYLASVVLSNFRIVFNADYSVVYLLFDVANRNGGTLITALFNGTGAYSPFWGGVLPSSTVVGGVYPLAIGNNGTVGLNTTDTKGYKLAVNGSVVANSITVKMYPWADYVFKSNYLLPSLSDIKAFISRNHHLPEIPSEADVAMNGLNLGEMNKLLLKKVEELTLYLIEKDKEVKRQNKLNGEQAKVNKQQKLINKNNVSRLKILEHKLSQLQNNK